MRRYTGMTALLIIAFATILAVCTLSCSKKAENVLDQNRLTVVASLFPLYDFAKYIGGERADVLLLLPPGVEPHSFEPTPDDIIRLGKANIFIYTNDNMEPWINDILKGINNPGLVIVNSSKYIKMFKEEEDDHRGSGKEHGKEGEAHEHGGMDPHVWLDFTNAGQMIDAICEGFAKKDPMHREFYRRNAESYKAKLLALDKKFSESLAECKKRVFLSGGHYSFGYLARRYNLRYMSAYGFSPDAEPNPKDLIALSKELKRNGLHYIFYEELISPRVAGTIAGETGAKLLPLNGAHNVSRDELNRNVTFLSLMEQNLENLKAGLECR
ncbi:MAG: metal ABC transporter substrate-binding protein [Syntrophales bacterium LBB04]|nr:metal ABC transporter substrate-binding protein [Syntrophales bacterium LBB04]